MDAIDLFCGAGGFSEGFKRAGFNIKYGFDIDEQSLETFNRNHKGSKGVKYDISDGFYDGLEREDVDLVLGSPPCQGFSHAGGSRDVEDDRNSLVFSFINWVDELDPKFFLMENVSGIRNISDSFLDRVIEKYESIGYSVIDGVLNSAGFGVPQKRRRYFILGVRDDLDCSPSFPICTHNIPDKNSSIFRKNSVLLWEAISDLPEVSEDGIVQVDYDIVTGFREWVSSEDNKVFNHIARLPNDNDLASRIPEGKMYRSSRFGNKYIPVWELYDDVFSQEEKNILWFISRHRTRKDFKASDKGEDYIPIDIIDGDNSVIRDLFDNGWLRMKEDYSGFSEVYDINTKSGVRPKYMRLDRFDVSNTITTEDFNPREKLHPTKNRGLSLREGARIQSFPDDFVFEGSFNSISNQIGNAVPPLLAFKLAFHIKNL